MASTSELANRGVKKITGEMTTFQQGATSIAGKAMGATALFIGATSILDASLTARRNKQAREEVARQDKHKEKEMKEESRMRRRVRRRDSRSSVNVGNTVMQMFEQRTGHHKMGSSKNFPV